MQLTTPPPLFTDFWFPDAKQAQQQAQQEISCMDAADYSQLYR
jgi:hypothetical protein